MDITFHNRFELDSSEHGHFRIIKKTFHIRVNYFDCHSGSHGHENASVTGFFLSETEKSS